MIFSLYSEIHILHISEIWMPLIIEEHKLNERKDFIYIIHPLSLVPRSVLVNIRLYVNISCMNV